MHEKAKKKKEKKIVIVKNMVWLGYKLKWNND